MIKRKGQGAPAANLVLVILLIIFFWILFLQPEDRAKLLSDNNDKNGNGADEDYNKTLLQEHIGRLDFLSRIFYEHDIQSVYLYSTTTGTVIKDINPFYIKNGVFDVQDHVVNFKIDDLENTGNVLLSFNTPTYKGRLIIKLNGNVIFENSVKEMSVDPIRLLNDDLKNDNSLEFSVSSVGWAFWKTNEYDLSNMKITGDVTDISTQESKNIFILRAIEKNNLETATLRFLADCKQSNVGILRIFMNNHDVFSGVPDCGSLSRKIPIDKIYLKSGENNVVFKSERGNYLIDQIKITTKLEDVDSLTYYFEMNNTDYEFMIDGEKEVRLILEFVDDDSDKEAVLNINGYKTSLHTGDVKEGVYDLKLEKRWLRKKNNYVDILPKSTLEILELRIELR